MVNGAIRKEETPQPAAILTDGVSLMELQWHHCRWPLDRRDPEKNLTMYCGRTKMDGSSYCRHHRLLASAGRTRTVQAPPNEGLNKAAG